MDKNKWILPYLMKHKYLFIFSIFLGVLTIFLGSALLFTSGYLISKAATHPESILMVYVPIVGVRAFGIGRSVISYIEKLTEHQFILKILSRMRVRLYKKVERQAYFFHTRFRTGDILGMLSNDIDYLQDFYLKTLLPSVVSLAIYALIILVTGEFSTPFAIFLMITIGMIVFIGPVFSYLLLKGKNEKIKIGRIQLYRQITDVMVGIEDWVFSGRSNALLTNLTKQESLQLKLEKYNERFSRIRDFIHQLILGLVVIGTIFWADGQMHKGVFSSTLIAACGLMMLSLMESFVPIAGSISDISTYQESLKRLKSIKVEKNLEKSNHKLDPLHPYIEMVKLSFHYPNGQPLLNDLNLTISSGEKIAIMGRSGAGKSTLLKLLMGVLSPMEGELKINGLNAVEVSEELPKIMGFLNQKPYLFNTTILNNIRLGNPMATDEEVIEAAKKVQLHEMIAKLPDGYHTIVHESGHRFSGGERQRIALARILLQNTPIIIMDEPTIGLDPKTERNLLKTIFETMEKKTIIWVTHHLTGISGMDRILFLDQGKIQMEGTHQQLVLNPAYQRLYLLDHPFLIE